MSPTKKLMPNLDQQTTKMLNLTVLQRRDSFIEEILFTAAHVSFYEFNIESSQWSRKDVEGSLFVVKRNAQPRFQFIVMNRRNADNLVENLLDFEYELKKPYLLYRNAAQEVNGIWFYNSEESEEVANLFNRILDAYPPPKTRVPCCKSEFEELGPASIVTDNPLKASSATPSAIDALEDPAFINCFSTDKVTGIYTATVDSLTKHYNSATVPAVAPSVFSPAPAMKISPASLPAFVQDSSDAINNGNQVANLLKPSTLFAPSSSSSLLVPPVTSPAPSSASAALYNLLNQSRQYGTPMLQPFPPPNPPPSLAPTSTTAPNKPIIIREKVHDALLSLVQDDQFIDMVFQSLLKLAHLSVIFLACHPACS
ncbi:mRNA-decapping enzyme-like protein [Senna tora]|uniref:mRNA-decapping enzyme-like protein n=1 Tax=Senna tora TaxID=362788 RepID=A0A834TD33_9FABA|nr:mRNA-decapping enzyme-like protein [Senna tora]